MPVMFSQCLFCFDVNGNVNFCVEILCYDIFKVLPIPLLIFKHICIVHGLPACLSLLDFFFLIR